MNTARNTNTAASEEIRFNMMVEAGVESGLDADDALLQAMLAQMDGDDAVIFESKDEIVEGNELDELSALELESIAAGPDDTQGAYEATEDEGSVADVSAEGAPAAKPKKVKKTAAAKEPKEPKEPRLTYHSNTKSDVLKSRLGDKASELLLVVVEDAALDADELAAKQAALLAQMDTLPKKVAMKATMLFAWLKAGGKLNEVMHRAFAVLAKDGELTSGPAGNLQVNLLTKYSPGTAASQAHQMFSLFPALSITVREKGKMVANPNSLILMKVKADLGMA